MSETDDTGSEGVEGKAEGSEEPAATDTETTDGTATQQPSDGEESGAKPAGWPGIS